MPKKRLWSHFQTPKVWLWEYYLLHKSYFWASKSCLTQTEPELLLKDDSSINTKLPKDWSTCFHTPCPTLILRYQSGKTSSVQTNSVQSYAYYLNLQALARIHISWSQISIHKCFHPLCLAVIFQIQSGFICLPIWSQDIAWFSHLFLSD